MVKKEEINGSSSILENYDIDWWTTMSIGLFNEGNVQEAKEVLLKIYTKYELNLDLNYNLGTYSFYLREFDDMSIYFAKFISYGNKNPDLTNSALEMVLEVNKILPGFKEAFTKKIKKIASLYSWEFERFPAYDVVENEQENLHDRIGQTFKINSKEYLCGVYDEYMEERIGYKIQEKYRDRFLYATEVIPAQITKRTEFCCESKLVIPIMPTMPLQTIYFEVNGEKIEMNNLLKNTFYYYTIKEKDNVILSSYYEFGLGDSISLYSNTKKPKVVLTLFVEGISQKMMNEYKMEYMPKTYEFFKKGTICSNAFSSCTGVLPDVSSMFSGTREMTHRIFHPNHSSENLYARPLFGEVFQQAGYNTAMIGGNWRITPIHGFAKGMNRYLYRNSSYEMTDSKIVSEIIELLESFKEGSNFIWADFMDLYWAENGHVKMPNSQEKYVTEHLDRSLGLLYYYLEENFSGQYIVSLVSNYEKAELAENKGNIVMMFAGQGVPTGECQELIESIDYFPILLNLAGSKEFDSQEGQIPMWLGGTKSRSYVITESICPINPYYIYITDIKYQFLLQTEENCTNDGMINMCNYKVKLVDRNSREEVSAKYPEKVEEYTDKVLNHIKEYIVAI